MALISANSDIYLFLNPITVTPIHHYTRYSTCPHASTHQIVTRLGRLAYTRHMFQDIYLMMFA